MKYDNKSSKIKKILRPYTDRIQLYLLLLPALAYLIIFVYKPMGGTLIAFENYNMRLGMFGSKWVGFDNFKRLFNSYWFPVIIKNTFKLSILSIILGFPASIIVALLVNEIENGKIKKTFQIVSYAPHFISTVVVCSMIQMFLTPQTGVIMQMLSLFGVDNVNYLQEPSCFAWLYVISDIWQGMGWGAIIYYAALSGVDSSLYEAADIDGASKLMKIIHINLPALLPTISIMFILRCGNILSVGYERVYLLQNDLNIMASEVISTYVYKIGMENMDFSFSTAIGLFNSVVNCSFLLIVNWVTKKISNSGLL